MHWSSAGCLKKKKKGHGLKQYTHIQQHTQGNTTASPQISTDNILIPRNNPPISSSALRCLNPMNSPKTQKREWEFGSRTDGCSERRVLQHWQFVSWAWSLFGLLSSTRVKSDCSWTVSIPGRAWAILLKRAFTLWPAFADVSMNMTLYSFARRSPSSVVTCLSP